jgi:hypothetical protein
MNNKSLNYIYSISFYWQCPLLNLLVRYSVLEKFWKGFSGPDGNFISSPMNMSMGVYSWSYYLGHTQWNTLAGKGQKNKFPYCRIDSLCIAVSFNGKQIATGRFLA